MALLELDGLRISYLTAEGPVRAVDGVSLALEEGESLGLVGESGCGKTTVGRSIIGILAKNARIDEGAIRYKGRDLRPLSYEAMRPLRWKEIAFIPQAAMNSFNPVYRVGRQIAEVYSEHLGLRADEALRRVRDLFRLVKLPLARMDGFPHQFSGGMRQRALVAMALALDPPLLIADEPTTALDVATQDRIFATLRRVRREAGSSLLLITHDIGLVAENCDRVAVMYAGRVVEYGRTQQVLAEPYHPYTMGLKNAFPSMSKPRARALISIPGSPPSHLADAELCWFAPRCPFAETRCWRERPAVRAIETGHLVACHRAEEAPALRARAADTSTWDRAADVAAAS
ncbi:MAG: ABC transporter ATP-binding protein [Alphaproteobacteria bacterium]